MNQTKIALQGIEGLVFVDQGDIISATADGNYTHVNLQNNTAVKVLRQLKEVEELLQGEAFIRVHRSHLVNINHVIRLDDQNGDQGIMMINGEHLPLARDRKMEFIEKFTRI